MLYLFCLLAGSRVNPASLPRTGWARKDKVDKSKVDKDNVDKDKVGQLNPVATRLCNLETMK